MVNNFHSFCSVLRFGDGKIKLFQIFCTPPASNCRATQLSSAPSLTAECSASLKMIQCLSHSTLRQRGSPECDISI